MNYFHLGLAALMLVTGSINTLSVKWADTMTSESYDGKMRKFNHPFLQACGMFLGEMSCMIVFVALRYYRRRKNTAENTRSQEAATPVSSWSPFVFLPPALMDMTATSIQYIALTLTYASSFQMLRGAVIIFTGLLSRIFLKRKLSFIRWTGITIVIGGLVTVGLCDTLYSTDTLHAQDSNNTKDGTDILIGDILIVCAQVIVGSQMVYEEKFISKYDVPALQAVGWEGSFGFLTLAALLVPMAFIPVGERFGHNPRHVLEDAYDGLFQLAHNPLLAVSFCGTVISIAFFNFAGISVTKEMSATTRMVLDSVRTLVIWSVSLAIGWQKFHPLQLFGFFLLLSGMCIYNNIIIVPGIRRLLHYFGWTMPPYEDMEEDAMSTHSSEPETSVFESPN